MDYEEELFYSLYDEYRESFDELNQAMKEDDYTQEYARGGLTIHRGFYCPSPVIDILVGGCDRGYLVRKPRSPSPVDYLYRKADGKLRIIDKYESSPDGSSSFLYQREFIMEKLTETVAPIYRLTCGQHDLSFLSLCRYDSENRIVKYVTFLPSARFPAEKQNCLYYGEQYSYDEKTGLLESVIHGQKIGKKGERSMFEDAYRFYHDSTGQLVSFQLIGNENASPLRMIAKRKRRVV